jgi:hypothetical protein
MSPELDEFSERWMKWMPDQRAWLSYINFELNFNEIRRAREIFERFVSCHTTVAAWICYAEFELKNGQDNRTRNVYQRAVEKLADDEEVNSFLCRLPSSKQDAMRQNVQGPYIILYLILLKKISMGCLCWNLVSLLACSYVV